MTAFEEMGMMGELARATEDMDWTLPTDVQAEAIPLILGGGDVLMAAETGSGKTGAFCLPVLQSVWETLKEIREGRSGGGNTSSSSSSSSKWALSVYDRGSAFAISPDGLRCQSREFKDWHGCRGTKGVVGKGAYYFETIVQDEGLCRVGWSTHQASHELGTDRYSFGFGGTGKKSHCKQFDDYGEPFGKSDVIGCCLDLDRSEVRFTKNGKDFGVAFQIPASLRGEIIYPAVVLKNAEILFNFGDQAWKHEPPKGFIGLAQVQEDQLVQVKSNPNHGANKGAQQPLKNVSNAPQAIIMEPSRELAEQTFTQIQKFKKYLDAPPIRELLVIGGVAVRDQIEALSRGVDIVVGTPGRLEELIGSGHISLAHTRFFILDEADGLLKAGYTQLIHKMHGQIPKVTADMKRLQMIVCSATLHDFEVKKLAEKLMYFPTWVDLKGEDAVPETVHHVVVPVDPRKDLSWHSLRQHVTTDGVHAKDNVRPGSNTAETFSEAVKLLKGEYCVRAIDKMKMDQALIFCRTKIDCDNLEEYLVTRGGGPRSVSNPYTCVCLHGDRKPAERKENLERFKKKDVKFLICTDVAARGLDISGLPFMINITLPDEKSNYVHRIGRVGRAERMGLAISLVATVPEKVWYHGQWCSSRGKNCWNTNLTDRKGCCVWYNEQQIANLS
ncbi:ATP-dependent RNA helicase Ddx1 isoform X2 [Folsomia candida]|uniref:ATP-dependent RNA helicase Ddx1 isoform X2 n=1 Tax=Folsomia candida TaxID=158441 RepID=UPI00160551EA|nr:ATP-dependent RNA helicase Ddx1 isoform X2 [Folsomia candida]